MKKFLLLLIVPILSFTQNTTLVGDVDCDGEITSEDASLILQFVTNVIDSLPCENNMTGLTPNQLEDIINMMSEQINIGPEQPVSMIGPMYKELEYPEFVHYALLNYAPDYNGETIYYFDAIKFCGQLNYNGFDDWRLPSVNQIQDYIENYGGEVIIPNLIENEASFWMRADYQYSSDSGSTPYTTIRGPNDPEFPNHVTYMYSAGLTQSVIRCFCIR